LIAGKNPLAIQFQVVPEAERFSRGEFDQAQMGLLSLPLSLAPFSHFSTFAPFSRRLILLHTRPLGSFLMDEIVVKIKKFLKVEIHFLGRSFMNLRG
jgi:hypothetical protein